MHRIPQLCLSLTQLVMSSMIGMTKSLKQNGNIPICNPSILRTNKILTFHLKAFIPAIIAYNWHCTINVYTKEQVGSYIFVKSTSNLYSKWNYYNNLKNLLFDLHFNLVQRFHGYTQYCIL